MTLQALIPCARWRVFLPLVLLCGLLAGCEQPVSSLDTDRTAAVALPPGVYPRSAASRAVEAHFKRVQNDLLVKGLMRTDKGGPDVPFSSRQLAQNFVDIALYDEYANVGGRIVARRSPSALRRWEIPVRMNVEFGATVPQEQRNLDRRNIAAFARRLASATRHPITLSQSTGANFTVLVLNEDDRLSYGPRLQEILPGIPEPVLRTITKMPRSTFCLVFAFSEEGTHNYTRAIALIRGEHPDLLRLSCIHEELAQGFGLANDSPNARPSVFNDDEEFALLTTHDELLLRMLYDRRLTVGMTEKEARPIVQQIATELASGAI